MRAVFMGTPDFAVPTLEKLIEAEYKIVAVVTQPDRRRDRGKKIKPSPVKECALQHGVPVLQPEKLDRTFVNQLGELQPDVIIVVAYGKLLPPEILNLPRFGCLNVHASLLPKYRGAAPIHRAIINGEKESGVSIMLLDEGMDTGPVFSQKKVAIPDSMTAGELHDLLAVEGAQLLVETLEKLPGGLQPKPQNDAEASYAPLLTKEDEYLNWAEGAADIVNRIRGMNPWPGAYTIYENKRLKIYGAEQFPFTVNDAVPGTVVEINDRGFVVMAGDHNGVLVTEVQMQGKQRMSAPAFLRGCHLSPGVCLGREEEQEDV